MGWVPSGLHIQNKHKSDNSQGILCRLEAIVTSFSHAWCRWGLLHTAWIILRSYCTWQNEDCTFYMSELAHLCYGCRHSSYSFWPRNVWANIIVIIIFLANSFFIKVPIKQCRYCILVWLVLPLGFVLENSEAFNQLGKGITAVFSCLQNQSECFLDVAHVWKWKIRTPNIFLILPYLHLGPFIITMSGSPEASEESPENFKTKVIAQLTIYLSQEDSKGKVKESKSQKMSSHFWKTTT